MDENIIKINLVECASELAHNRTFYESGDVLNKNRFNEWYDYYYTILSELEVVEV